MAENITTSSESKRPKRSPIITKDDEKFESKMNRKDTAILNTKSLNIDRKDILVETNLHRLIQNKLKRKKKVTVSQDSNEDLNTKKRKTKFETIQSFVPAQNCDTDSQIVKSAIIENEKRVVTKPPLPPKSDKTINAQISGGSAVKAANLQSRLKRKLEDNTNMVQKLNARAEQLRLEITDLKTALNSERTAVRTLRAQNEAETRKSKTEIKKLQTVLDATKKSVSVSAPKKSKDDVTAIRESQNNDLGKLTQEISALKDANRALEEKILILSEAERRKTSDIRSQKDSYEIRLTQITKSAKTEINRLLEEIKTKERNIGLLKKEMHSLKSATNKKDIRNAQHPPEMRKLKEIERTQNTESSNQKCISTTCGDNEYNSMPHEITERILEAHDDLHIFRNKDPINSDTDSALSSAPPSISPQPPTSDTESPDIWQSVKNYSKELSNLQNDNESLQRENESLKKELESAKQQIEELEKSAIEARNNTKMQQLMDRLNYLQRREDTLETEAHELREQNELLEFRILELEESNDKWSLRSNSTPDTRDMWTDTEKECDDLLYPDRSDSGITSPHCQHHSDERNISPYDLSMLDPISNDELRRRITAMTKRSNFDEYDKLCLLQILSLLNNLEIISQDSEIVSDDIVNIDVVKAKTSDYISAASSPRSFLADPQSLAKSKSGKIVATVLPYSSTLSSPQESPRKARCWQTSSLQESGVFEADPSDSYSQCTQTDPDDFPCPEGAAAGDLCAEIQKLNKFREKIEECVTKSTSQTSVPAILSPNLSEQRKLQYYKDRLEILENKLVVYESSGDQQAKRLAERLQREVQLESLVKDFKQRIELLEADNHRLEEERCEFEEAENDTRLRLQRLEVDLEILSQGNLELEMSKEAVQNKLQEARIQCTGLQESIERYQDRVNTLESEEKDLKNKMNLIKTAMPAILLFNTFIVSGQCQPNERRNSANQYRICQCHDLRSDDSSSEVRNKLHQLMTRERELTQNITELNRAYNETLESADNLWAQMEKDYKERLLKSKQTECLLKTKIAKLEERLAADSQSAVERLSCLEENENCFKNRICKLNKENKDLTMRNEVLHSENQKMKHDYSEMKNYVEGFAQQTIEREKQKNRKLEEDVTMLNKMLKEVEDGHEGEMQFIRNQVVKTNKELLHIEVTNSELKEEVVTLETRICELLEQHRCDEDKIRNLADELRSMDDRTLKQKRSAANAPNLAEELAPNKRINIENVDDLSSAAEKLAEAIAFTENCKNCTPGSESITEIAKDIKILADVILRNRIANAGAEDSSDPKPPGDSSAIKQQSSVISRKDSLSKISNKLESGVSTSELPKEEASKLGSDNMSLTSLKVIPLQVVHEDDDNDDHATNEAESVVSNPADEDASEDNFGNESDNETEMSSAKILMHMQMGNLKLPNSILHDSHPFDGCRKQTRLASSVVKTPTEVPSELRKIALHKLTGEHSFLGTPPSTDRSDVRSKTSETNETFLKQLTEELSLNIDSTINEEVNPSSLPVIETTPTIIPEPSAIDTLLTMISESIPNADKSEIGTNLLHLHNKDVIFRQNLNLVLRLGTNDSSSARSGSVRSFEQISRAMECIRAIEAMYDPIKVPAIESLRNVILNKLLKYFMKSPEKLRCVVCLPKDRSNKK